MFTFLRVTNKMNTDKFTKSETNGINVIRGSMHAMKYGTIGEDNFSVNLNHLINVIRLGLQSKSSKGFWECLDWRLRRCGLLILSRN